MSKKFLWEISKNAGSLLPEIPFITMFIGKQHPKNMNIFAIIFVNFFNLITYSIS